MRKGQSGMNAAMLVAIISALIVLYIIFLPSEDRLDLIGDNGSDSFRSVNNAEDVLLEDFELIMEHFTDDEIEHDLPSVTLYSTISPTIVKEVSSAYVKRSLFGEEGQEVSFGLDDVGNTDNMLLSFSVRRSKGRLNILINDRPLFSGEIEKVNADPITIPRDYLTERNTLSLSVSSPGMAFWRTNEYLLENLKVTADVTDTQTQNARLSFVLSREEAEHIEESRLRFVPECQEARSGVLDILINTKIIYSSVPDCGTPRPLTFNHNLLQDGENSLEFRSSRGRYLIDQIRITNNLEEVPSFTWFFEVSDEQWDDIDDGRKDANLTLYFTDDEEDKAAEIIINSRKTFMTRHDEFQWSLDITRFLEQGSNSLKIVPDTRLEVRKLEIVLDDD